MTHSLLQPKRTYFVLLTTTRPWRQCPPKPAKSRDSRVQKM